MAKRGCRIADYSVMVRWPLLKQWAAVTALSKLNDIDLRNGIQFFTMDIFT